MPAGGREVKAPAPWWWVEMTAVAGTGGAWLLAHPHGQAEAVALAAGPTVVALVLGLWRVEVDVRKEDE